MSKNKGQKNQKRFPIDMKLVSTKSISTFKNEDKEIESKNVIDHGPTKSTGKVK